MTNEEAIKGLKNVSTMFTGYKPNEEMFAMAIKALETVSCIKEKCAYCPHCENCDVDDETLEIKALEQQPCEMTVEEYRNRLMDAFHNADCDELIAVVVRPEESEFKHLEWLLKNHYHNQKQQPCDLDDARENFMNDVYNTLDFLPTNNEANRIIDSFDRVTSGLKQQPCEDCISRKDMLAVLRQSHSLTQAWDGFEKLPSVTPKQEPCEDCISRQAVMYDLCNACELFHKNGEETCLTKCESYHFLATLPSVTPKEKTAHWINKTLIYKGETEGERDCYAGTCSACGGVQECWNYCGGCGARMVEQQEKSEYEHDHEVVKAYNDGQTYILDKIRAEIEEMKLDVDLDIGNEIIYNNAIKDVLEIIDKYRG